MTNNQPRFKVEYLGIGGTHPYAVLDTAKVFRWVVAQFFNKADANEYIDFLNDRYH